MYIYVCIYMYVCHYAVIYNVVILYFIHCIFKDSLRKLKQFWIQEF